MSLRPDGQSPTLESTHGHDPASIRRPGPHPDALGDLAKLPAQVVAREHPQQWADSGLPDSLTALDTPLETVWAAVQLALSGADLHTLASTLGLTDDTASHIIIATTEQLITSPANGPKRYC
jgi:hypothetical protein